MRTEAPKRYPVYVPKVPRTWWLRTAPFRRFAAREFTAVFAAVFSVILLLLLFALSQGKEAYEGFLRWLRLPAVVGLSSIILLAMLYHAGTWFRLTAHIQVMRIGRTQVPRPAVVAALFGIWIVVSAIVAYLYVWF
ncbi:MAG: fumarate reductase subunit C [Actinobacteria bacterium]|nr:fumarate reductase subunit C [Actinomycetota bacterium]